MRASNLDAELTGVDVYKLTLLSTSLKKPSWKTQNQLCGMAAECLWFLLRLSLEKKVINLLFSVHETVLPRKNDF